MLIFQKKNLRKIPEREGIYFFKNSKKKTLYIGKAKNLRSRVASYLQANLYPKTKKLVSETRYLAFQLTGSDLEATLLEAHLVKLFKPKYNIQLKDDKSPIYIGITKEKYPRIITLRKNQIASKQITRLFGPFISAPAVKKTLTYIRKIFPFATHRPGRRECIYSQIKLCDPCPSKIENIKELKNKQILKRKYMYNLRQTEKVLSGNFFEIRASLEKKMKYFSLLKKYETAAYYKSKLTQFETIHAKPHLPELYLENPNLREDIRSKEVLELKKTLSKYLAIDSLKRIECYDVSHLSGTFPTASMVTWINGETNKNYYRHFRITQAKKRSDVDSIREVFIRRKKHFGNWGKPHLIIVDGGKPQVSVANKILGDEIPLIGLAKRYETLVIQQKTGFVEIRVSGSAKDLVQRLRNEAHRFAKRYHHMLVKKHMLT